MRKLSPLQRECARRAGCISLRRSRATGTVVGIYAAAEADMDVGARYAVVCEDHGVLLGVDSLAQARSASPLDFCDDCRVQEEG